MMTLSDSTSTSPSNSPLPSFAVTPAHAPLPALIRATNVLSSLRPMATYAHAVASSSRSITPQSKKRYTHIPTRLPLDRPTHTLPVAIPSYHGANSRSRTRTSSPPSSRSPSVSSVHSFTSSTSWSSSFSDGPKTPSSTSPFGYVVELPSDTGNAKSGVVDLSNLTARRSEDGRFAFS